jgi:hypothetical protein
MPQRPTTGIRDEMRTEMPRAADPDAEHPITRTVLLDARLRHVKDIERVEIREIRILPGYAGGLHVHNGPVVGSILEGSVIYLWGFRTRPSALTWASMRPARIR